MELVDNTWVHFVAVGGTGMGALAVMLKEKGCRVTGSDKALYPPMSVYLEKHGIVAKSFSSANLEGKNWGFEEKDHPDLVVVGNVISKDHEEVIAVEKLMDQKNLQRMSFAQALAEWGIGRAKSFVVSGTHGKSTTTSLLSYALKALGKDPGFFMGAIPADFPGSCQAGAGDYFVSEGDEYDTAYWDKESKFLHYKADWVICTGVEFDHADIFKDLEAVENAFLKLVDKSEGGWILIESSEAPSKESVEALAERLQELGRPCLRYGFDSSSDYRILSLDTREREDSIRETIVCAENPEREKLQFTLPIFGRHNALNALAAVALLEQNGLLEDNKEDIQIFRDYRGIKRRQEQRYFSEDLVVVDDFAHHPTAIEKTIEAIKMKYPTHQVAAFFEPRSATSARNVLSDALSKSFIKAEATFMMPPTKDNVPEEEKLDMVSLEESLRRHNRRAPVFIRSKVEDLVDEFFAWKSAPCVALVMSNGPFGGIHDKIIQRGKAELGGKS